MKFATIVSLLFSASLTQASVLQRRDCAANNIVRAAKRLQSESNFCSSYLATSTYPAPQSLAATPRSVITSACSCAVKTTPPPVLPTYTINFDADADAALFVGRAEIPNDAIGSYGVHSVPGNAPAGTFQAHSGSRYLRGNFKFEIAGDDVFVATFGSTRTYSLPANQQYTLSFYLAQVGTYTTIICDASAEIINGLPPFATPYDGLDPYEVDDIPGGDLFTPPSNLAKPDTSSSWKLITKDFPTGTAAIDVSLLFSLTCTCDPSTTPACDPTTIGAIEIAIDDIKLAPASS
ncbi:hypothetical protein ABW20_dc0105223 [Dactylellina cionopaga]|nr:hypothetical protein ABW20_dc0105223 [Dactylellina cionopaga]